MSELVLTERDGPVAVVILNRPDALNAFNEALYDATTEALMAAAKRAGDWGLFHIRFTFDGRSRLWAWDGRA